MADKFKTGDKVEILVNSDGRTSHVDFRRGAVGIIHKASEHESISETPYRVVNDGDGLLGWFGASELKLVKSTVAVQKPDRFILQYKLDSEKWESCVTEKDVRDRIAELVQKHVQLKRDSIVVHEIKITRRVELGTKITFKK